jgi:tetratricopeptide (TPR) repeat protein
MTRGFNTMASAVFTLAAFLLIAPAAVAGPADDTTVCFSLNSDDYKKPEYIDRGLNACTRLIGRRTGTGQAAAYRARGYWKHQKGDLDAALTDYDISIKMDPKHVEGYDYRADVYQDKGELDRAIADYNTSIRINPSYASAYYSRGRVYEKQGKVDLAVADYKATLTKPAKDRIAEWAQRGAQARLKELGR